MANPTTAKPTKRFTDWVNTGSTVGELMKCLCIFPANGIPRDVRGNVIGEAFVGNQMHGTGHPPAKVLNAFTFNSLSDPVYRFTAGSTAIRFAGRGWTSLSNNRTFFIVVKPVYTAGPVARIVPVWGNATDSFHSGIGLNISTAGVINVGRYYGSTVTNAGITLTSGKTYLISLTVVSTTSNLLQVYCYDDQAYVTPQSTGTTFVVTAPAAGSTGDAILNPGSNNDGYSIAPLYGDVYVCGLSDATFDPATNGYFAALVADPCVAARGDLSLTGTLASGGIVLWDETTTSITVHTNMALNGNVAGDQDRYQYRLHRSLTPSFTPDSTTRVTALQDSPVLVDTTAVKGLNYFYKVECTDSSSTAYSTTTLNGHTQVSGRLSEGDFFFGIIGDSRWGSVGGPSAQFLAASLRALGVRCGFINYSLASSSVYNSGTPALSWQPNTTQDAVNGQASTVLLANALVAFTAMGVTHTLNILGVNDASAPVILATFTTKYNLIKTTIAAASLKQVYVYPYLSATSEAATLLLSTYYAVLDAMANNSTIFTIGKRNLALSASSIDTLSRDSLHYAAQFLDGLATARSLFDLLVPTPKMIG